MVNKFLNYVANVPQQHHENGHQYVTNKGNNGVNINNHIGVPQMNNQTVTHGRKLTNHLCSNINKLSPNRINVETAAPVRQILSHANRVPVNNGIGENKPPMTSNHLNANKNLTVLEYNNNTLTITTQNNPNNGNHNHVVNHNNVLNPTNGVNPSNPNNVVGNPSNVCNTNPIHSPQVFNNNSQLYSLQNNNNNNNLPNNFNQNINPQYMIPSPNVGANNQIFNFNSGANVGSHGNNNGN